MTNEDEIRRTIEQQISSESKMSQAEIEDIVMALKELGDKKTVSPIPTTETSIVELNVMMVQETDWRKRASLAARIISLNLE